jgi:hypothetical protein
VFPPRLKDFLEAQRQGQGLEDVTFQPQGSKKGCAGEMRPLWVEKSH